MLAIEYCYSVTDMKIKDMDRLTEVVTSCTMVARGDRKWRQ